MFQGNSRVAHRPSLRCTDVPEFTALQRSAMEFKSDPKLHLKHLLADAFRCQGLIAVHNTSPAFEDGPNKKTNTEPQRGAITKDVPLFLRRADSGSNISEAIPRWKTIKQRRIILDYSRQHVTGETMELLFDLADKMRLTESMNELRNGLHVNLTENKSVMHHVLRLPRDYDFKSRHPDGDVILNDVHNVLDKIREFSEEVRGGKIVGSTGKPFKNILCIGVGGNFSGPEAVYEALRVDEAASKASEGRGAKLRFCANVDPVDFHLCTRDFDPGETLVIITSKSFTTSETMQNARLTRRWLVQKLCGENVTEEDVVAKHFCAITADVKAASGFGIMEENIMPCWDWVGCKFSVWSAAGILPLSLHYSFEVCQRFLHGAHDIDEHFFDSPLGGNIPVILGLLCVYNSLFCGYHTRCLLPYAQSLKLFPSMIAMLDMESNGKRVTAAGMPLAFDAGVINFGEAGSLGVHSFYQLLHQGRTVPADFIGFMESQSTIDKLYNPEGTSTTSTDGWDVELEVSGHGQCSFVHSYRVEQLSCCSPEDELMSNFFAQPDALACGKTLNDLIQEGVDESLRPHKVFPGNRPSSSILMTKLDAFAVGQLLAIYEHRTIVQGFIFGVNSFDQFSLDFGNERARRVRAQLSASRRRGASVQGFNSSSGFLLEAYLSHGKNSR